MLLAYHFAESAKIFPRLPVAPALGLAAAELIRARWIKPGDFAAFPDAMGAEHFAVINAPLVAEHMRQHLPYPDNDRVRQAAGCATVSLLTTVTELFRGEQGAPHDLIPKLAPGDEAIAEATERLGERSDLEVVHTLFTHAAQAVGTPEARRYAEMYRLGIGMKARSHGATIPTAPGFARKQEALDKLRGMAAGRLSHLVGMQLERARQQGHLPVSPHQAQVAAHNLTRWQLAPEWFAPAA